MADTSSKAKDEAAEASGATSGSPVVDAPLVTPTAEDVNAGRDVVAMPSLKSDGKPDQTAGYKVLDEDGLPKAASTFDDPRKD